MRDSASIFADEFPAFLGPQRRRPVTPEDELRAALALGWVEQRGDRFVITEAGRQARARGDRCILRDDGPPMPAQGVR